MSKFAYNLNMLPQKHIVYGAVFSAISWTAFPALGVKAVIIWLASFLIDFDHYLVYVFREKKLSPKKAFMYFKKMHQEIRDKTKNGTKVKSPIFLFHSLEFLSLLLILSFFYSLFFFIFVGFAFHLILDTIDMQNEFKLLTPRDYSIIQHFINKKRKQIKYL